MQIISDAYYSAERSFADKSKMLCLQSITRAANLRTLCNISFPLRRLGILKEVKKYRYYQQTAQVVQLEGI